MTGHAAPPLLDMDEWGPIWILDITIIRKFSHGSVQAVEISDLPGDEAVHAEVFDGLFAGRCRHPIQDESTT